MPVSAPNRQQYSVGVCVYKLFLIGESVSRHSTVMSPTGRHSIHMIKWPDYCHWSALFVKRRGGMCVRVRFNVSVKCECGLGWSSTIMYDTCEPRIVKYSHQWLISQYRLIDMNTISHMPVHCNYHQSSLTIQGWAQDQHVPPWDWNVGFTSWGETKKRHWYVFRPSRLALGRYCVSVSTHSLLYSIGEYDISVCVSLLIPMHMLR